jgi:hypothetical protein
LADWNEFSMKRILEVKQRIQTVVRYEEVQDVDGESKATEKEAIVDSYDRPIQASYT